MGAPAYVIYACLLLLMAVALTLGYCAVYNMDSKQVTMINQNIYNKQWGEKYANTKLLARNSI